eukprot:361394-Chlamydomonas_euryale.AAC.3
MPSPHGRRPSPCAIPRPLFSLLATDGHCFVAICQLRFRAAGTWSVWHPVKVRYKAGGDKRWACTHQRHAAWYARMGCIAPPELGGLTAV